MAEIITFGEIMLRLMPEDGHRFMQNDRLEATFGGGEANVAVSLANCGEDVAFVTALPKHAVGQAAVNALRYFGVDTSKILRQGKRIGIYFAEKGQSQRPSRIIYDREHSAIAEAAREDFDWDRILEGTRWFHFTGITPAIAPALREICLDACRAAKERGITVSCDLNYRKKLWTAQEARETMTGLMPYIDVCIANEEDAGQVLGITARDTDVEHGTLSLEGYQEVAEEISRRYGCERVAVTLRSSVSANDNRWAAMMYSGGNHYCSRSYDVRIWDRIGGGDSFGAGLIYALRSGKDDQATVDFAVASPCRKRSIKGVLNRGGGEGGESRAGGDGRGRVQR